MSMRHGSSDPQPHPAVLPHLRRFETPDMAQSSGCPQEALGTGWDTAADCELRLTHRTGDLAWPGMQKKKKSDFIFGPHTTSEPKQQQQQNKQRSKQTNKIKSGPAAKTDVDKKGPGAQVTTHSLRNLRWNCKGANHALDVASQGGRDGLGKNGHRQERTWAKTDLSENKNMLVHEHVTPPPPSSAPKREEDRECGWGWDKNTGLWLSSMCKNHRPQHIEGGRWVWADLG